MLPNRLIGNGMACRLPPSQGALPSHLVAVKPRQIAAGRAAYHISWNGCSMGADTMRCVLAMGLLIVLCTSASAATVHHAGVRDSATRHPPVDRPGPDVNSRARFAVPGWSDEATRRWLNSASSNVGRGG